ncbi:unnamed protein product [Brachionus calyciflorus]|uniref:MULE transposase domain-containing protein n=1 Tax=Brachionus calyciflorus TaxID=104777 RepID=A0A813YGQ7_9BILA|nr:unnamed protein product [Brachionus calyciflorus]
MTLLDIHAAKKEILNAPITSNHASIKQKSIPCCFVLSQKRDETTYPTIFAFLKDLALSLNIYLNPKKIMADFEQASTKAFRFPVPMLKSKGVGSIFRFINSLGALALLPIEKVEEAFIFIKTLTTNEPKCDQLNNYFEQQWIKNDLFPLIDQQETSNLQPIYPDNLNQIAEVYSSIEQIQTVFNEPPYQIEIIEREETYELDEEVEINEITGVGEPVQIAELEQPVQIAELEQRVQIAELEQPVQIAELEQRVQIAELEQPVQQVEIFQIVQTQQPELTYTTLTSVPTVSHRPRLAEILKDIDLNNLDDEEVDYIGMISNKQALEKINSERELRKKERAQTEKLIEYRISSITEKQKVNEVHKIWETSVLSKRICISQCDKIKAIKNMEKRIREEEEYNLHIRFLERNQTASTIKP